MYLSAERLALANTAIQRTFEQTSIAWQVIPQWDIGDPGALEVRDDVLDSPGYLPLDPAVSEPFELTLAQIDSPSPDPLLNEVIAAAGRLAAAVDTAVIDVLETVNTAENVELTATTTAVLQSALIDARVKLEDNGFRALSCLLTNTEGLKALSTLGSGYSFLEPLLTSANINSLHRVSQLGTGTSPATIKMLMVGRRQRIAHGAAADASPGEEPVDIAVSLAPTLQVVGEVGDAKIRVAVCTRFATRVKDENGIVGIVDQVP